MPDPIPDDAPAGLTRLLLDWESDDPSAREELLRRVYEDLHLRAARYLRRERRGHTLQPTALVNEAYLRLIDQRQAGWKNRAHFFAIAAQAMRRILVDHARRRATAKRGAGASVLAFDEALGPLCRRDSDLVALDEALDDLARFAPRPSRVVELRFFGGLTIDETAAALGVSPATVKTDWQQAKAWLYRQIGRRDDGEA